MLIFTAIMLQIEHLVWIWIHRQTENENVPQATLNFTGPLDYWIIIGLQKPGLWRSMSTFKKQLIYYNIGIWHNRWLDGKR